jgi:peptide/nickel transport system permease protein
MYKHKASELFSYKLSPIYIFLEAIIIIIALMNPPSKFLAVLNLIGFLGICIFLWKHIYKNKLSYICCFVIIVVCSASIAAPLLPIYPPSKIVFPFEAQLQAPTPEYLTQRYDGNVFILGVDQEGRDLLSRILWGTRQLYFYVVLSTLAIYTIGVLLGLMSAYYRSWFSKTINFISHVLLSIPTFVLYIVLLTAIETSLTILIFSIILATVPRVIRLVYQQTTLLEGRGFALASKMRGDSHFFTMVREILPNLKNVIIIDMLQRSSYIIITLVTIGYLGLSPSNSYDDLGRMLREYAIFAQATPSIVVIPTTVIIMVTLSLNFIAIGVRKLSDFNRSR